MIKNVIAALVCFVAIGNSVYASISLEQREALEALYARTSRAGWNVQDGWNGARGTECDWDGVTCDKATQSKVLEIDLSRNNLAGSLPADLGALTHLEKLDLGSNALSGPIPSELGGLSSLEILNLSNNELEGFVSTDPGDFASLRELHLNKNKLNGGISHDINNLSKLEIIDLSDNESLGQSIPSQIADIGGLKELYLNNAGLKGAIPGELFSHISLTHLDVGSNMELSFGFDDENLDYTFETVTGAASKLVYLNLSSNLKCDPSSNLELIPEELGNLSSLEELYISGNTILTGDIPDSLGTLSNLTTLYISSNERLVSKIPSTLGNLAKLTMLDLSANKLKGSIPNLGALSELLTLDLSSNMLLGGQFRQHWGLCRSLTGLTWGQINWRGKFPMNLRILKILENLT